MIAFGLSKFAGSDAGGMRTVASSRATTAINGEKKWCTNAGCADIFSCSA